MDKKLTCFLVVGRMGKSLVYSKAEPFSVNESIGCIYIFSENTGIPLSKTRYIILPSWIGKIRPLFISKFLRIITEPLQLIYYAIKLRPDLIIGYHLIPKGINALIASRLSGAKSIISLIGGPVEVETYSRIRFLLKPLNLFALKKTDLVTTKGTVVNNYLKQHNIDSSKIIIYNGSVNLEKFKFDKNISRDIDILFVGTFRNLKGPDRVIYMVNKLRHLFPGLKVNMVGGGYLLDKCREISKSLDLEEIIEFTGPVENTSDYYKRARILAMPSRSEGLPTSMLEAMVCGCVPVVSGVGNIKDVAKHLVNTCIVEDYLDIDMFTGYISLLLRDEKKRNEMAAEGIKLVVQNYSAETQSEIVDEMINKIFSPR